MMLKIFVPLNPQIEMDKPEIWQLVSSITIYYIWKARCLKVFQNVTERPAQIIFGLWIEIVHNLRGAQSGSETKEYFIDRFLIRWSGSEVFV